VSQQVLTASAYYVLTGSFFVKHQPLILLALDDVNTL